MNLTIVIPYRNEREALTRLLGSLPLELPVVVVDDMSDTPPDAEAIERLRGGRSGIRVLRQTKRGYFAGAVNAGLECCDTDVLVLNQDIWFEHTAWLDKLLELCKEYAIIGDGVMSHPAWPKGYVQGTFMFMRRDAINAVGDLNARDWPLWGGTAEWQLRACRQGFRALPLADLDWFRHERKGEYGKSIAAALAEQPGERDWFIRTPPLISLVVPCYNYGRFLPELIDSLMQQSFQAFDVTIVDDASTDNSAQIAEALADDWKGIHLICMERNGGAPRAINKGIRSSYGRYVMRIDADDMLKPDALEKMYRAIEQDPRRVVYSWLHIYERGKFTQVHELARYNFGTLLEKNMMPAACLMSRDGWREAGGYPEEMMYGREDWAMAIALGEKGYCGHLIPEPLYIYRKHGKNRSMRNTDQEWRAFFMRQLKTRFSNLYEGDYPMGCCGGRRTGKPVKTVEAKAAPMPGKDGMVLLEYVGANVGRTVWIGDSGTRYVVKGSRRLIYVDKGDVDGMLKIIYGRQPAFRISRIPVVKTAPEPQVESGPEPVVEHKPEPGIEAAEVFVETPVETEVVKPKRGRPKKAVEALVTEDS